MRCFFVIAETIAGGGVVLLLVSSEADVKMAEVSSWPERSTGAMRLQPETRRRPWPKKKSQRVCWLGLFLDCERTISRAI
jgi:hypothetical protein